MAKTRANNSDTPNTKSFMTPEAQENYLINLASKLVEKRMLDGSASSQEVTHFLRLGSRKETLEREKLEEENKLLRARTSAIESQKQTEELYREALDAMRRYSGNGD